MEYTHEKYIEMINEALKVYLGSVSDGQDVVLDAMKYSAEGGGKRIRPVLTLEFCRVCGGDVQRAIPFACAVEMIHTYSLIHDDLPCMDNDDMRRGKPSCHKAFGEEYALLAGDGLLTLAFETLSKAEDIKVDTFKEALFTLSNLAGINGMVGGQVLDLKAEKSKPTLSALQTIDRLKTGALIKAACTLGCLASEKYDGQKIAAASVYAENIGLAFQIVDDILDVTSDTATLGKPVGSDDKNEKITYVKLMGIGKSQETVDELTKEAVNALGVFDGDTSFLEKLAYKLALRKK